MYSGGEEKKVKGERVESRDASTFRRESVCSAAAIRTMLLKTPFLDGLGLVTGDVCHGDVEGGERGQKIIVTSN